MYQLNSHLVIVWKFLFLLIESVDHNSYEQVEYEKWANDHETEEEKDVAGTEISLGHLVDLRRIDSIPHDIQPALSRHHAKHCGHGSDHVVEITFLIDPFAAVVDAVPLGLNLFDGVFGYIARIAIVKFALQ